MVYIFDSNSFVVISHYFPERFPTFWKRIDEYVTDGKILSVREVFNELDNNSSKIHLLDWIKVNKNIFMSPTQSEMNFVNSIFQIPHFQYLVSAKQRLKGNPVADPFVIAAARIKEGCVVTEEDKKKNSARIPNICDHFNIPCTNVEGFMEMENWKF